MQKTILLVSRDEKIQANRTSVLKQAGYRTMRTGSLTSAVQLAAYCQMVVIGNTFSFREQNQFISTLHDAYPSVLMLCLRFSLSHPNMLLAHVADCFGIKRGESRIRVIEESNLITWPKKAS
jgi:hypothetical protein